MSPKSELKNTYVRGNFLVICKGLTLKNNLNFFYFNHKILPNHIFQLFCHIPPVLGNFSVWWQPRLKKFIKMLYLVETLAPPLDKLVSHGTAVENPWSTPCNKPKSKSDSSKAYFRILYCIKATGKMLVTLTPGVDVINPLVQRPNELALVVWHNQFHQQT